MSELRREELADGAIWRVVIDGPPGNVIDAPAIAGLRQLAVDAAQEPGLKAILFVGEGKHFSFGASVEEHLPEEVESFLPSFGAIFRELAATGVPCAAAVRGMCLGGGTELAAFCHFVFCDDSARFSQAEVALGVFPPVAAVLLPAKVGQTCADDWIITGRRVKPDEAEAAGLITARAREGEDVEELALAWLGEHLGNHSAFALRHATRASRVALDRALDQDLAQLERQYLHELMKGSDPVEGLKSFLEKRAPEWTHR